MGASAAVGILHRKKLAAAAPGDREALHAQAGRAEHERIAGGVSRGPWTWAWSTRCVEPVAHARGPDRSPRVRPTTGPWRPRQHSAVALAGRVAARGSTRGGPLSLDHLVHQGDGGSVAALAVRLELGVPGGAEQVGESVLEVLGRARTGHQTT